MFVVASIIRGFGLAMVFLNAEIPDAEYPRFIGMIVGMFIGFLIGIILCIGAFGLLTQSNLSAARSAAIISAIPCIGCFVFPFGIWSCILLYSEPAKRDFSS